MITISFNNNNNEISLVGTCVTSMGDDKVTDDINGDTVTVYLCVCVMA